MPVCFKRKFKFIHIPKTGGSSFEKVFDLQHRENLFLGAMTNCVSGCWFAPQHFTHRMINSFKQIGKDWFSFTIVRNPYTKIISEYFYINKNFNKNPIREFNEHDFVEWFKNDLLKFDMDHKLPQHIFIDAPVNMILKFEKLEEDFAILTDYMKVRKKLIHDNKSIINKKSIAQQLSLETKKLIYSNFKNDFEAFGYSF